MEARCYFPCFQRLSLMSCLLIILNLSFFHSGWILHKSIFWSFKTRKILEKDFAGTYFSIKCENLRETHLYYWANLSSLASTFKVLCFILKNILAYFLIFFILQSEENIASENSGRSHFGCQYHGSVSHSFFLSP